MSLIFVINDNDRIKKYDQINLICPDIKSLGSRPKSGRVGAVVLRHSSSLQSPGKVTEKAGWPGKDRSAAVAVSFFYLIN